MESQPQNPEFRNNPENFHPCNSHKCNSKIELSHTFLTVYLINIDSTFLKVLVFGILISTAKFLRSNLQYNRYQ